MLVYLVALAVWLPYGPVSGITYGWHFDLITVAGVLALTLLLVTVCWIKGKRPRWHWGK